MTDENKSIRCDVTSCEYNDCSNGYCTVNEIKVSCSCNPSNAKKGETICESFSKK